MKYAKILGLLAVAAAALMAFAGTASATTVTADGSPYTGNIVAANSGGHVVLDNPIATINCSSKVEGDEISHGSGITASGAIDFLNFTGCTNSWHVTVVTAGTLEIHSIGNGDGTLTSSGATVEATRFGITCRYSTSSTHIGTVADGEHAVLTISASIPFHSGSGLCGEKPTSWTGKYAVSSPTNLSIDA